MRFERVATGIAVSILTASMVSGQGAPGLSITGYEVVSTQAVTSTLSRVTYRASLLNSGAALASATATVSSLDPFSIRLVPRQDTLTFEPVPANSHVASNDTFTILADPSVPLNPAKLQWTFETTLAPLVANAGPNQTVSVGSTVILDGSGSTNPSGIGTLTYSWFFTSRPAGSAATLLNVSNVNPTFVANAPGTYVVTLTVSNGVNTSSANVIVSTSNSPPVARAGPNQTVKTGSKVVLNGSNSTDVDGDSLTYRWRLIAVPQNSTAKLTGANTVSAAFVVDKPGKYVAQLLVNDGTSDGAPSTVTIATKNSPPVAHAGPGQVVSGGATVQLDGSGSTDVDGDPLTYQWSLVSTPAGSSAALSSPTDVNPTFTADLTGTYVAQLIVNDGTVDSDPATVPITTNAVQAPTADAGPSQAVQQNTSITLSGNGSDPQGLAFTFQWALISQPQGSTAVLSANNIPNPTFFADLAGTYVAQLQVNNGFLSSAPSTVTITTASNTLPLANAGPNQGSAAGATVTLDGGGSSDADNNPLTYSWSFLSIPNGSAATLAGANTIAPTFVIDVAGTYVVQLIVNDGFADSNPATVTIATRVITLTPNPLNLFSQPGTLTVTLTAPAGPGGQVVNLASLDPGLVSVPSAIRIHEGAMTGDVTVTPLGVGSTLISAGVPGLRPGIATVNVSVPDISLALAGGRVGPGRTISGTITLSAPAPPNGAVVSLSASPSGVVDVQPATVTIPGGSSASLFTVTGSAPGAATITASASGYNTGAVNVNVGLLGQIFLQNNVTIGPGEVAALQLSLVTPAPSGGVTITLSSDDNSTVMVTPTVTIPERATTPDTPPQVTGVNFGSATIRASATGFTGDSQTVKVTAALSFAPNTLTVDVGDTQNLTLTLSGLAPAGGLTINLGSSNPSAATVPPTATIAEGANSVTVPVTGIAQGSSAIHASAPPNLADTSAKITVVVP